MQGNTTQTIQTILDADTTIAPEHKARIIAAIKAHQAPSTDRMLTTRAACQMFDPDKPIHPVTLRRYEKLGLLAPKRITARRIRWPESQIRRLATEGAPRFRITSQTN